MEILGIGTEITEVARIARMIAEHGESFLRRVYTEGEIRACQAKGRANEHFAGRWAAKEAILKALGTGPGHGVTWTDVEVRQSAGGKPSVLVRGAAREFTARRGVADILVAIARSRHYATAYALVLGAPNGHNDAQPPKTNE